MKSSFARGTAEPAGRAAARPREASRSQLPRSSQARRLLPLAALAAIVALWQAAIAAFNVQSYFIPSPSLVGKTLWTDRGMILHNAVPTILEALTGFAVGNVLAVLLAIWFVHFRAVRQTLYPLAIVIQSLPIVAIAPILIVAFGTGFASKAIMTAIIAFFPTLVNTVRGLEAMDPSLLDLFRSIDASRWHVLRKLRLPNALPYIFVGLRITASASVIGAIIAEWIGATRGLGFLVINSTYEFNTPLLWATLVASSVLVLLAFGITAAAERMVVSWDSSARGGAR